MTSQRNCWGLGLYWKLCVRPRVGKLWTKPAHKFNPHCCLILPHAKRTIFVSFVSTYNWTFMDHVRTIVRSGLFLGQWREVFICIVTTTRLWRLKHQSLMSILCSAELLSPADSSLCNRMSCFRNMHRCNGLYIGWCELQINVWSKSKTRGPYSTCTQTCGTKPKQDEGRLFIQFGYLGKLRCQIKYQTWDNAFT